MKASVLVIAFLVLMWCACERTQLAPAPGSGKEEIVRDMLAYMKDQEKENRAERKETREALYRFIEKQSEENRKFLRELLEQWGKYQPATGQLPANLGQETGPVKTMEVAKATEQKPIAIKASEAKPVPDKLAQADSDWFVEKDELPEPVPGVWNENAKHIDPRSFAKDDLQKYPLFANEDRDADPNVPEQLGGKGFGAWAEKNGWETNKTFTLVGDVNAKKGGRIVRYLPTFPANLRPMGEAHNTQLNGFVTYCMWQTLLGQHDITKEWIPNLASHWKHSSDGKTHYFRINPNAKWSDGSRVTTEDVAETYRYYVHPDLGNPSYVDIWSQFEPPVIVSKYIISFTEKEYQWNNWKRIATSFYVLPKKDLASIEPKDFNRDFNYLINKKTGKTLMGSGAYTIVPGGIVDDQSAEIVRKKEWWAKDDRANVGLFNFDTIRWIVVLEDSVALEKAKKGEIDVFAVMSSKQWVEQISFREIQKGWMQKRKVFNHEPEGTQYIAMNQERPPFDQWEVRRAFSHLFPFEKISSQLMYNVYIKLTSYYPGYPYENLDNPVIGYDKEKALQLLAKVGYKSRDPQTGLLVNENGEPLKVTLVYRDPGSKPHNEIFQNACKEVGITLTLQLQQGAASFHMAQQRDYQMYSGGWVATPDPAPDTHWKSTLKKGTNNITGLQSEKLDKWIDEYNREFDYQKRIKLMHLIDRELVEINPYILTWYAPFHRLIWWNKFSYPPGVEFRYQDDFYLSALWWYDEEKAKKLADAMQKDESLLAGGSENKFWNHYRDWLKRKGGE
jgi:microcin C transport system substrate-binding protein